MKASELVAKLQKLIERHGDLEVRGVYDCGHGHGEVDAFWYLNPYPQFPDREPHIAVEVNDGGGWDWERLPEEQRPPIEERRQLWRTPVRQHEPK